MSIWLKNLTNWITPNQAKTRKEPFSLFCNCTKCRTTGTTAETSSPEPKFYAAAETTAKTSTETSAAVAACK